MIDLKNIEGIYFVGIGGIGMSALALYFAERGYETAGYDRSETMITGALAERGCTLLFDDDIEYLPPLFREVRSRDKVLIVYTPAVRSDNRILTFFRSKGYKVFKRSEMLGAISKGTDTLAIAGTHGKTTISTMTAHLLREAHIDCTAFLGGVSKNFNSNFISGQSSLTVIEADEFDRSFHSLTPLMAVITALDADHLEIYGDRFTMVAAYNEFCRRIKEGGTLIVNSRIKDDILCPGNISLFTYGADPDSDFRYSDILLMEGFYKFNLKTPYGEIRDLRFPFPGKINIENLTAAIALALKCGAREDDIRKGALLFKGVRRRFDIRINKPGLAYIDDYAHHPREIEACIDSLREYFSGRKITGIFQPHLFTRTLDHADGFAKILDRLDEVILLPVYPAREEPIPGVSSQLIFDRMKLGSRKMMQPDSIPGELNIKSMDVLVTIGAGDIDKLVAPIEKRLMEETG